MSIVIRSLAGEEIASAIDALAALRMTVFAEWPYLYDGDTRYERAYLREFIAAPDAILVVACDGDTIVGAATASPMSAQKAEFRDPFAARGFDEAGLFYFGESVLLPTYRGRGIGHAFFDFREEQAVRCGARSATFAAVVRPREHPDRPAHYRPLDAFWRKRGYEPLEGLLTGLAWKDHRDRDGMESTKQMQYWLREFG